MQLRMDLPVDPAVLEEQKLFNASAQSLGRQLADPRMLEIGALRRSREFRRDGSRRCAQNPEARDILFYTEGGMAKGRFFGCDESQGLAVHFHGGGWALGSIYNQDDVLTELSQQCSLDVLTIDYPLAPEAGLAEIIAWSQSAMTAIARAHSESPIVIVGESAGAHLALASILAIRDHAGLPDNIRALSLFYGIFDLSMTASQRSWGPEFLGLSTPWLEYFYELILPSIGLEERRAAWISPLYADLAGLPPALLSVGTLDPLIDDSTLLHAKWLKAGNIGRLDVYPEAPHGFNHSGTAMARQANRASCEFLRQYL